MPGEASKQTFDMSELFPVPGEVGPRDWGKEILLALVPSKFSLKLLKLNAGAKGGLQFHHRKDEVEYLLSGTMIVRFDLGDGKLQEALIESGTVLHFPPGLVHQTEAVTDCVILEASSPHFNDRVRVEDRYGLPATGGLPSTSLDEVIEK